MKNCASYEPLLKRRSLLDEIDAELAARDLGEFVRQAWPIVEPSTPFMPGWHIDAIVEHLEAVSRACCIFACSRAAVLVYSPEVIPCLNPPAQRKPQPKYFRSKSESGDEPTNSMFSEAINQAQN
jgi:hypothetical protein